MGTATKGRKARMTEDEALQRFGTLYRNAQGFEVWAIHDSKGRLVEDDIASDHDAAWIAVRTA